MLVVKWSPFRCQSFRGFAVERSFGSSLVLGGDVMRPRGCEPQIGHGV